MSEYFDALREHPRQVIWISLFVGGLVALVAYAWGTEVISWILRRPFDPLEEFGPSEERQKRREEQKRGEEEMELLLNDPRAWLDKEQKRAEKYLRAANEHDKAARDQSDDFGQKPGQK